MTTTSKKLETVIIRFAGDSGDGMQLVGDRFTAATAHVGNDLSTLPDFPAEIRAPAGTPGGVSAFQTAEKPSSAWIVFRATLTMLKSS